MPLNASTDGLPQGMHKACMFDVQVGNAKVIHRALRDSWLPLLLASAVPHSSPRHALAEAAADPVRTDEAPHQMVAQQICPVAQPFRFMGVLHPGCTMHTHYTGIFKCILLFPNRLLDGKLYKLSFPAHITWLVKLVTSPVNRIAAIPACSRRLAVNCRPSSWVLAKGPEGSRLLVVSSRLGSPAGLHDAAATQAGFGRAGGSR